jgi:hypothetical protein
MISGGQDKGREAGGAGRWPSEPVSTGTLSGRLQKILSLTELKKGTKP